MAIAEALPLRLRISNAIYSYLSYIAKGIWPTQLAVFYPHPEDALAAWRVAVAALILAAITLFAWLCRKRHRCLLAGWLWYLIAMFPMIGIVQVGRQAMADRYAYLPFVGLFIATVWGMADLFERFHWPANLEYALAISALLAYASVAFLQTTYWRNSYTLFQHALAGTNHNGIAEDNFGAALMEMGRPDLALPHFEAAASYMPWLATAHYNLGVLHQQHGEPDAAIREYQLALKYTSDPKAAARAHNNLGFLNLSLNNPRAAQDEFSAALHIVPDKQNSLLGRGMAEYKQGNLGGALTDLSRAAQMAPLAQADFWLGRALEDKGEIQAAIESYDAALQLQPAMSEARERRDALRGRH